MFDIFTRDPCCHGRSGSLSSISFHLSIFDIEWAYNVSMNHRLTSFGYSPPVIRIAMMFIGTRIFPPFNEANVKTTDAVVIRDVAL